MYETQRLVEVELGHRIRTVGDMKREGYRLVAITCTKVPEGFELTYSFDKDYDFVNLRVFVPEEEEITSITGIYYAAFIYENELKDLFGIKIRHIKLDYEGHFYQLATPTPFNPPKEKATDEAPAAGDAGKEDA